MDRIGADFDRGVQTMIDRLGAHPVPIQLPIGAESDFLGIIDLVEMKAIVYKDELGKDVEVIEIPADLADEAQAAREHLLEEVSHYDDELRRADPRGGRDPGRRASRRPSARRRSRSR